MKTLILVTSLLGLALAQEPTDCSVDSVENCTSTLWPLITPILGPISDACSNQSWRYIEALQAAMDNSSVNANDMWALQMLDSSGYLPMEGFLSDVYDIPICTMLAVLGLVKDCEKLPQSLQSATMPMPIGYGLSPGSYKECIGVKHQDIKGQYCFVRVSTYNPEDKNTESSFNMEGFTPNHIQDFAGKKQPTQFNINEYLQGYFKNQTFKRLNPTLSNHPFILKLLDEKTVVGKYIETTKITIDTLISEYYPQFKKDNPDFNKTLPLMIAAIWIQTQTIFTGFVMGQIYQTNVFPQPFVGQCFPSECTLADININYVYYLHQFSTGLLNMKFGANTGLCVDSETKADWTWHTYVVMTAFSILAVLLVIGTLVDVWNKYSPYQTDLHYSGTKSDSFILKALSSFSLPSNLRTLLATNSGGGDRLDCLDGIRFISMTWVVLGHSFAYFPGVTWTQNYKYLLDLRLGSAGMAFAAIMNATQGGPVDSFFLLSGTLVSYLLLKELDRNKGINDVGILMFYVHRYLRLTIPYLFMIGGIIILPTIATGPAWQWASQGPCEACIKYWYQNIFYLNVFGDHALSCMGLTWYLSNDMIFYWFSLPIVYVMWKCWRNKPLGATIWIGLMVTGFTIANIYVKWEMATERWEPHHMPIPYFAPWHRCVPYLLGLLLGYALHKTKGKPFEINGNVNLLLWIASFLMAFAIVYGNWDWDEQTSTTQQVVYNGLMRTVWGLSLMWPIFSCCRGYGGLVNEFLSWKFFGPLSKLTFLCYLFHMDFVIPGIGYSLTFPVEISLWLMVGLFLACLVVSLALAFAGTLAFEIPFVKLEKLVFAALLGARKKNK